MNSVLKPKVARTALGARQQCLAILCLMVSVLLVSLAQCRRLDPRQTLSGRHNASQLQPLPAVTQPQASKTPRLPPADSVIYKRRYRNYEYGYAINIPGKLVGRGEPAPAPAHGIEIPLSANPEERMLVDGSYNSAEILSLEGYIEWYLDAQKDEATDIKVLQQQQVHLHNLPARRITIEYTSKLSQRQLRETLVAAIRWRGEEVSIIYEIVCTALAESYEEDIKVFDQVVKSWQLRPLPK